MCHLLLLAPVFGLSVFYFLPLGDAWIVYSILSFSCGVVYWLIWREQCRPAATGSEGMIGGVGKVIQIGKRTAKIFYRGEIWNAISTEPLSVGDSVEIARLERMTLIVRKVVEGQARQAASLRCHRS